MKALVYHGPGRRSWDTVPDPALQDPTDAIVRIDSSTICGTDLHILKGDVPEVKAGTILGHEAVGTIVEIGAAVTTLSPGDRVLVSCITACGRCRFCKEGHYGLCTGGGGWIFGHTIDGLQAELARVPFADTSLYKLPEGLTAEDVGVALGRAVDVAVPDTVDALDALNRGEPLVVTAPAHPASVAIRALAERLSGTPTVPARAARRGLRWRKRSA